MYVSMNYTKWSHVQMENTYLFVNIAMLYSTSNMFHGQYYPKVDKGSSFQAKIEMKHFFQLLQAQLTCTSF